MGSDCSLTTRLRRLWGGGREGGGEGGVKRVVGTCLRDDPSEIGLRMFDRGGGGAAVFWKQHLRPRHGPQRDDGRGGGGWPGKDAVAHVGVDDGLDA